MLPPALSSPHMMDCRYKLQVSNSGGLCLPLRSSPLSVLRPALDGAGRKLQVRLASVSLTLASLDRDCLSQNQVGHRHGHHDHQDKTSFDEAKLQQRPLWIRLQHSWS